MYYMCDESINVNHIFKTQPKIFRDKILSKLLTFYMYVQLYLLYLTGKPPENVNFYKCKFFEKILNIFHVFCWFLSPLSYAFYKVEINFRNS